MKNYTVRAWLVDKRYDDNCRLVTYDTDSFEDAQVWASKIKKAYGDSVEVINRINKRVDYIELRVDQKA